jgi:hypothetical protein
LHEKGCVAKKFEIPLGEPPDRSDIAHTHHGNDKAEKKGKDNGDYGKLDGSDKPVKEPPEVLP